MNQHTHPRRQKILDYLEEHGESSTEELAENEGVTRNAVSKALAALEKEGKIESRVNPSDARERLRSLPGENHD